MANTVDTNVINQINTQNAAGTTKTTSQISDQQSRFLKLLTTQLQNQDPLNPMDNAQMTSQMAQISTVDGIERLNATLQTMMSNSNTETALQAAAIVGHGALVKGNSMQLGTNGAIGGFELASGADQVKIEVKDKNGTVIRHLTLTDQDAGVRNFIWDGKDDAGMAQSTTDPYTFSVAAQTSGADVDVTALQFGTVTSVVRNSSGGVAVDVGSLGRFDFADVKQII